VSPSNDEEPLNSIVVWIDEARAGSGDALARLMEFSRQYLLLIASTEWPADLRAKAGVSDLVQETQMEAVAAFAGFRGRTESELLAWLRQILLHNLRDFARRYTGTDKRRVGREFPLDGGSSNQSGSDDIIGDEPSPSSDLRRQERDHAIALALAQIPDDYRQVIEWHHREDCSFEEIGRRLGRSEGAARKLWARAIHQLQERLRVPDESH
jgi:RNA polymerase sigma-70 factor (ECF subfamily)